MSAHKKTAACWNTQPFGLGDEGFDNSPKAKAKTTQDDDLYARLYALDPGLAQLLEVWPMLVRDARQAIVDQAIQSASVTNETK